MYLNISLFDINTTTDRKIKLLNLEFINGGHARIIIFNTLQII